MPAKFSVIKTISNHYFFLDANRLSPKDSLSLFSQVEAGFLFLIFPSHSTSSSGPGCEIVVLLHFHFHILTISSGKFLFLWGLLNFLSALLHFYNSLAFFLLSLICQRSWVLFSWSPFIMDDFHSHMNESSATLDPPFSWPNHPQRLLYFILDIHS